MPPELAASPRWPARILAASARIALAASAFGAFRLLNTRCEGVGCTYVGVAWLSWVAVLYLPATLLGVFAQRSRSISSTTRSTVRVASLLHGVLALVLLGRWVLRS